MMLSSEPKRVITELMLAIPEIVEIRFLDNFEFGAEGDILPRSIVWRWFFIAFQQREAVGLAVGVVTEHFSQN